MSNSKYVKPCGRSRFQDRWLCEQDFKFWLKKVENDEFSFTCVVCKITNSCASMGRSALLNHMKSNTHQTCYSEFVQGKKKGLLSFGITKQKVSDANNTTSQTDTVVSVAPDICKTQSSVMGAAYSQKAVDKAAIIWIVYVVNQNLSLNSTNDIKDVVQEMFPDSQIAKSLQLAKTKSKYAIEFGIHPYLRSLLTESVENSPIKGFVILFDESYCKEQGKKQLDYHIRFWHGNKVCTRYLDSEFLGSAKAVDLFQCFKNLDENDLMPSLEHMIQISMDGPNVNLLTTKLVEKELMEFKYMHTLLDIGTCGLHTIHNAFKISTQLSKKNPKSWGVPKFLQNLHYLFKDAPARVEEYQTVTGAKPDEMPKAFSSTRWLENVAPARRGLHIVDHLKIYVEAAEDPRNKSVTNPKNSQPFNVVKAFVQDPLAKAKLGCFISYSKQFENFLRKYQTDRPMAPYLLEDIIELCNHIASLFIRSTAIEDKDSALELEFTNYDNEEVAKPVDKVITGNIAREQIRSLISDKKITTEDKLKFKEEAREMYTIFLTHMKEKSPGRLPLTKYIRCLNPELMKESKNKDFVVENFSKMCTVFRKCGLLQIEEIDDLVHDYTKFLKQCKNDQAFLTFKINKKGVRLDELFYGALNGQAQYKDLWEKVIAKALVLSHGQATVERGFSQNKQVTEYNQVTESIVARRAIKDHINFVGGRSKFVISDGLLKHVGIANQMYRQMLKDKKKEESAEGKKRKHMQDEIDQLRKKKKEVQDLVTNLDNEGKAIILECDAHDVSDITKGRGLLKQAKEEKERLRAIDEELERKQSLFNNCSTVV